MRRNAKIDDNHAQVVDALRKAGCKVMSLAAIGKGCPDILAMKGGRLWLLEVKDGSKAPSARKLTPAQIKWHAEWVGAPVVVVETAEQALQAVGAQLKQPQLEKETT